jgi:putative nucleotidyltransferase with HDIG domain
MGYKMLPTKEEAEQLLIWAEEHNPGAWVSHSRVVARVAETIALNCDFDAHKAYVFGLLHDIGRYEGIRELHHVYAGYELMKNKGYDQVAEICLSHSFPYQNIAEYFGKNDCSQKETEVIESFLLNKIYTEYDRLIQLCDALGTAVGVSLIEVRIMDVIRRYGFTDLTLNKIESVFKLKAHFDKLCDKNIYDLFYDEIRSVSFR